MPEEDEWVLLQYGVRPAGRVSIINNEIFRDSLEKSLFYAFLSLPGTNANVSIGTARYGHSLEKRIENIIKGLLAENVIIDIFSQDSNLTETNYIDEYPIQTPYWDKDICDAVKFSGDDGEILSQVDVKGIFIDWDAAEPPSIPQINQMELVRSSRAPDLDDIIERPLIMLMEEPWRNFNKLRTQYETYRMKNRVRHPHENLCFMCPKFTLSNLENDDEFLNLYQGYYNNWESTSNRAADFIAIHEELPERLQRFTINATRFPESIQWVIENWENIETCLDGIIDELLISLRGFWVWIFGFINKESAQHFERVYQNDSIRFNGKRIWNSATRSPHEKKWTNFQKGRRRTRPSITGDDHPHLYWNNNTIDISSKWVYAVADYL